MAKLKNLRINNFKFFSNDNKIPSIDGKHLLIYGENGSGKSTIYWALYTLLEAASKKEASDIEKYFRKGAFEVNSLVNIHAPQTQAGDFSSFIEAEIDNGRTYRISLTECDIRNDGHAKLSNTVTDFINYQLLYKIYDFRHSQDGNLFSLFETQILPYVDFSPIQVAKNSITGQIEVETRASKILDYLWEGPGYTQNSKGAKILIPKHYQEYKDYMAKLTSFNNDLDRLLTHINVQGKQILQEELGYKNFEFKLELTQKADIDKKDKWFDRIFPIITLKIPEYNGVTGVIHRPQSFLNEARLSALSLAIRLAVLDRNYNPNAELKMLVLDDLLLSLDMANRDKILEILLEKYTKKYQIILLTHEFRFFEITKKRFSAKGQNNDWLCWEMYVAGSIGDHPRPLIISSTSHLGKAKKFLREYEFAVAGNFLRKEAERFLKHFLPYRKKTTKTFGELDLNGMISNAIKFADEVGLSPKFKDALHKLDEYRKFILNPLSHDSIELSVLKSELQGVVDILEYFSQVRIKTILKAGDELNFSLSDNSGIVHDFVLEIRDELKLIEENQFVDTIKIGKCPFFTKYSKNGTSSNTSQEHNDIQMFFDKCYQKSDKSTDSDFFKSVLLSNGHPLGSLI